MSLSSLLLRVLLSFVLIANGIGAAQAGARMQAGHHAEHVAAAGAQVDGHAGCNAQVADATNHASAAVHAGDAKRLAQAGLTDCCKAKACSYACSHSATCATLVTALVSAPSPLRQPIPVAAASYPQPRLPHLIRPPIG